MEKSETVAEKETSGSEEALKKEITPQGMLKTFLNMILGKSWRSVRQVEEDELDGMFCPELQPIKSNGTETNDAPIRQKREIQEEVCRKTTIRPLGSSSQKTQDWRKYLKTKPKQGGNGLNRGAKLSLATGTRMKGEE